MKFFSNEKILEINSNLKDKGIVDNYQCNSNLNNNNILQALKSHNDSKNQNLKLKDSFQNMNFKQIREHIPSFLKKFTGKNYQSGNIQFNKDNLSKNSFQSKIDIFNGKINMNNKINMIDHNLNTNLNNFSDKNCSIKNNPNQVINTNIVDLNNINFNLGSVYNNNSNYCENENKFVNNEIKKNQNFKVNDVDLTNEDINKVDEEKINIKKQINNYFDSSNNRSQPINNINLETKNILNSNNLQNNNFENIYHIKNYDNNTNKEINKNLIIKSHCANIIDQPDFKSIKSPLKLNLTNKEKNSCFQPVKLKDNLKRKEKECINDEIKKFNSWSNPNNINNKIYNSINNKKQNTNNNSWNQKEDLKCESNIAKFNSVSASMNNFSCNSSVEPFKSCDILQKESQKNDLFSIFQKEKQNNENINNKKFLSSNNVDEDIQMVKDYKVKKKFNDDNNFNNFGEIECFDNFSNFLKSNNETKFYERDNVKNKFPKDKSYNIENNFPLEAKFITNNKKIFFNEEKSFTENLFHNNDKNDKNRKNLIKEKLKSHEEILINKNLCPKNEFSENPNLNNLYNKNASDAIGKKFINMQEFNTAIFHEYPTNIETCKDNKKMISNILNKKSFNNIMDFENKSLIKKFDYNKNNKKISNSKNNIESIDFIKKYNTSDAIRPPKIFLDLNEITTLNNLDPMLIVTAEIDKKKNILNNYRSTNSNQRSNRSTSNDSKEFGSNSNINNFNSKEANNIYQNLNSNNSGNYNNFDLSNNFNLTTNSYKIIYNSIKNKEINKTNDEKNKFAILNDQCSDILSNNLSINNRNLNLTNSSKSNKSLKKKLKQENQIFFPTEINIFDNNNNMSNDSINHQISVNKNYIYKESKATLDLGKLTGFENEIYNIKNESESKEET